jgi:hypothetical protein
VRPPPSTFRWRNLAHNSRRQGYRKRFFSAPMYILAPSLIHRRLRHLAQYNELLRAPSNNYLLIRRRQLVARPHLMKPPTLDACLACSGCCTTLSLEKTPQAFIRISNTAISLLKLSSSPNRSHRHACWTEPILVDFSVATLPRPFRPPLCLSIL